MTRICRLYLMGLILIPITAAAQLPVKNWSGKAAGKKDTVDINLDLAFLNVDTVTGKITYYSRGKRNFQTYSIKGRVVNDSLILTNGELLDKNMPAFSCNCYGEYRLQYTPQNGLTGTWAQSYKPLLLKGCENTDIFLNPSGDTVIRSSLQKYNSRKDSIFQKFEFSSSEEIEVSISDYGVIDGDIISVIYNDSLVTDHFKLNSVPLVIQLTKHNSGKKNYLKVCAENLGKIPPNTAYILIKTKTKEHRFQMPSDYKVNGVVEIDLN
jgi:hypothetical protein